MGCRCLKCVSGVEFLALPPRARLRSSLGSGFRRKGQCVLEWDGPWYCYESHRLTEGGGHHSHKSWGTTPGCLDTESLQLAHVLFASAPTLPSPLGPCPLSHFPGVAHRPPQCTINEYICMVVGVKLHIAQLSLWDSGPVW